MLFPLFFLIIIGFTFGSAGQGETSRIRLGVVNLDPFETNVNGTSSTNSTICDAFVQGLKDANFTVSEYSAYGDKDSNGTAAFDISNGNIKAAIVIPENFTETLSFQYRNASGAPVPTKASLAVYTDPSDPTGSLIAQQGVFGFISGFIKAYQENIINNFVPAAEQDFVKVLTNPIDTATHEADISGRRLRWIDYMVPGVLGLALIWAGLNRASVTIANERTAGTFQRMVIAPVSPMTVLAGKFLSCLLIVYMSALVMLATGVLLFQVSLFWNIPLIVALIFLGSLTAIGLGLIISSLAKNADAANAITIVISVPLQFFIGAFFPLSIMPVPAQVFGETLPFTKFVEAMQDSMTKNLPLQSLMPQIVYVAISGIALFAAGITAYWWSIKRL
jgi:ABC-2 type transport system permease protein